MSDEDDDSSSSSGDKKNPRKRLRAVRKVMGLMTTAIHPPQVTMTAQPKMMMTMAMLKQARGAKQ